MDSAGAYRRAPQAGATGSSPRAKMSPDLELGVRFLQSRPPADRVKVVFELLDHGLLPTKYVTELIRQGILAQEHLMPDERRNALERLGRIPGVKAIMLLTFGEFAEWAALGSVSDMRRALTLRERVEKLVEDPTAYHGHGDTPQHRAAGAAEDARRDQLRQLSVADIPALLSALDRPGFRTSLLRLPLIHLLKGFSEVPSEDRRRIQARLQELPEDPKAAMSENRLEDASPELAQAARAMGLLTEGGRPQHPLSLDEDRFSAG